MDTFRDIIEQWPSRKACADAIAGANVEIVKKWHQRNSIPATWWPELVAATGNWDSPVTLEILSGLNRKSPRDCEAAA